MRIAIIGSGALGLYYGAMLQRGGNDVRFLLRSDHDAIRERGLTVHSVAGDFHLPVVTGVRDPGELGECDLVIVALKTFANGRLPELVPPAVGEGTLVLTLQNGLGNEEALAAIVGGHRVLGGVAFLCANRLESGSVHHLGAGRILVGEYEEHDHRRVERVAEMFRQAGVECGAVEDLVRARWEKLVWNIPFNGLSALLQRPVDFLVSFAPLRALVRELMLEVVAAAGTQTKNGPLSGRYADAMIEFTEGMGPYQPSMMIDRRLGRQLELDSIFAIPLERALHAGVPMVRVQELHALLLAGEQQGDLHSL
jgi:2-dehydropantoate 2-reductase